MSLRTIHPSTRGGRPARCTPERDTGYAARTTRSRDATRSRASDDREARDRLRPDVAGFVASWEARMRNRVQVATLLLSPRSHTALQLPSCRKAASPRRDAAPGEHSIRAMRRSWHAAPQNSPRYQGSGASLPSQPKPTRHVGLSSCRRAPYMHRGRGRGHVRPAARRPRGTGYRSSNPSFEDRRRERAT